MIVTDGRPDFGNPDFGKSVAKRHPGFVYSNIGSLVHRVKQVELRWWTPIGGGGHNLVRLDEPHYVAHTMCGAMFLSHGRHGMTMCERPLPTSEPCLRCIGEPGTFTHDDAPTRRDARGRIGCGLSVPSQAQK